MIVDINSYTEWLTVQIQISWLLKKQTDLDLHYLFVCVEVLWPSQPNGVISSAVSLANHMFTGQA